MVPRMGVSNLATDGTQSHPSPLPGSRGFATGRSTNLPMLKPHSRVHDPFLVTQQHKGWLLRRFTRAMRMASNGGESVQEAEGNKATTLLENRSIPDTALAKQLGLSEEFLNTLMELPGTKTVSDVRDRLLALSHWQDRLRKGILPSPTSVDWPAEPFRSKFIDVLKRLEMPRFTRRYPKLLGSLLRQLLELAKEFEGQLEEEENKRQPQQSQSGQGLSSMSQMQDQQSQNSAEQSASGEQASNSGQNEPSTQNGQESEGGQVISADNEVDNGEADVELQLENGQGNGKSMTEASTMEEASNTEGQGDFAEQLAEEMLKKLEEKWSPMVEALETAALTFEDIDGLLDGPSGFDSSSALWHQTGWREVAALRKKLEDLRELRELVRSLGRGSGKGPLRRAPEQIYSSNNPAGVIRSEQCPEETRGLTRSGDLSRMLPAEAHLLAAGWPRQRDAEGQCRSPQSDEDAEGSRACRLLFMARRAERQLMSYERTGWAEGEPSKLTGRLEIRPAAELGPIIVCLDTSGSMYGSRELVAKALTLECLRGAHRQKRDCYVYAFSGPQDVMELELGVDPSSISRLLSFMTMGFSGGTDVDAPLALSLERLGREGWALADILMVTDGEIPRPKKDILSRLDAAKADLGLEVHGLLVGPRITAPMEELCNHLHVFKSWSAVGGRPGAY